MTLHRRIFRLAVPAALAVLLLAVPSWAGESFVAKVRDISDGDTLVVTKGGRPWVVQIAGIDAPELGQSHGEVARDYLDELADGKKVTIEVIEDRGRRSVLAKVTVDGRDLASLMVEEGHAWVDDASATPALREAQSKARTSHDGLWAASDPVPPWEYRKSA